MRTFPGTVLCRLLAPAAVALQVSACDSLVGSGTDIAISPDTATVYPGDAFYLRVITSDSQFLSGRWSSMNADVAHVTSVEIDRTLSTWGVLLPIAPGTASVTVRVGDEIATGSYTVTSSPPCDHDCWTLRSLMPKGRKNFYAAEINGLIYVIGGSFLSSTAPVLTYDPAADRWDSVATDSRAAGSDESTGATVVNDIIYRVASTSDSTWLDAFNPASGQWSTSAPALHTQRFGAVAGIGEFVYLIGGLVANPSGPGTPLAVVERYDPLTDTWSSRAPMPTPRGFVHLSVADGIIYAIGGIDGSEGATLEAYDPETDRWTPLPPVPTPRSGFRTAAANGLVYVVGGVVANRFTSLVEAFDPVTATWSRKADVPVARASLGLVEFEGRLFAIGGTTGIDINFGGLGFPRPTILPRANYMYTP